MRGHSLNNPRPPLIILVPNILIKLRSVRIGIPPSNLNSLHANLPDFIGEHLVNDGRGWGSFLLLATEKNSFPIFTRQAMRNICGNFTKEGEIRFGVQEAHLNRPQKCEQRLGTRSASERGGFRLLRPLSTQRA